jgi:hypothetical protein
LRKACIEFPAHALTLANENIADDVAEVIKLDRTSRRVCERQLVEALGEGATAVSLALSDCMAASMHCPAMYIPAE